MSQAKLIPLVPSRPVLALASLLPEEGRTNHTLQAIGQLAGAAKPEPSREGIVPRPRLPAQHFHGAASAMPEKSVRKPLPGESNTRQVWEAPSSEHWEVKFKVFFWEVKAGQAGSPHEKPV